MSKIIRNIIIRNTSPAYKEQKKKEAEAKAKQRDPDYRTAMKYFSEIDWRAITEQQKKETIYKYIKKLDENERVKQFIKDYYEEINEIYN